MYTLVRIYLRRKRRNASDDLGVREVELIPAPDGGLDAVVRLRPDRSVDSAGSWLRR